MVVVLVVSVVWCLSLRDFFDGTVLVDVDVQPIASLSACLDFGQDEWLC